MCTADWIKRECLHSGAVWGRHMLIVLCYDRDRIESEIAQYVDGCTGKDFGNWRRKWRGLALGSSRIIRAVSIAVS